MTSDAAAGNTKIFWIEFWLLWGLGVMFSGAMYALFRVPTTYLAMSLLMHGGSWGPEMFAIEWAQSAILLGAFVYLGLKAAHALGLGAPILEGWLRKESVRGKFRAILIPAVLAGVLLAFIGKLPNLAAFQPDRSRVMAEQVVSQPNYAEWSKKMDKLSVPVSPLGQIVQIVGSVVTGEEFSRLFLVSVVAWMVWKSRGSAKSLHAGIFVLGVVIAAIASLAIMTISREVTAAQLHAYLGDLLPQLPRAPRWTVISLPILRSVPADLCLGFVYVRWGLEAAALAALVAGIVESQLIFHSILRLL